MNDLLANVRHWLTFQKIKHQATQRVDQGGIQIVAWTMFMLNLYAASLPRNLEKKMIYAAKDAFIRWLYQNGYCLEVIAQQQTLACHSCAGEGKWYTGSTCYRCNGSGIYRQHTLYQFTFDVEGQHHIWHQPKSRVDWKVKLNTSGSPDFNPGRSLAPSILDDEQEYLSYLMTVIIFLVRNGVDRSKLPGGCPGLRECLIADWEQIRVRIKQRFLAPVRRYRQRLPRAWKYLKTGDVTHISTGEEIPF